jgi:CO dehydrogenase/acetyl-CoA synthase beta subunit
MENVRSLSYEELERDVEQLQRFYKVLKNFVENVMEYTNLSLFSCGVNQDSFWKHPLYEQIQQFVARMFETKNYYEVFDKFAQDGE